MKCLLEEHQGKSQGWSSHSVPQVLSSDLSSESSLGLVGWCLEHFEIDLILTNDELDCDSRGREVLKDIFLKPETD